MNCEEANRFCIVDYLSVLGYEPKKIRGHNFWYLSPLRVEREPSFKVDRAKNLWYDHGIGVGGTLVDFGIRYHVCNVREFLALLSPFSALPVSSVSGPLPTAAKVDHTTSDEPNASIKIITVRRPVTDDRLLRYAATRNIEPFVLNMYCREIVFALRQKQYTAIGFANSSGGWELRNEYFQASSSPKSETLIDCSCRNIIKVFEGFFDFLSFYTLMQQGTLKKKIDSIESGYLILNSLSFFKKSGSLLEGKQGIHLYLDRDTAGRKCAKEALLQYRNAVNCSSLYRGYKDVNEWHRQTGNKPLTRIERGKGKRGGIR